MVSRKTHDVSPDGEGSSIHTVAVTYRSRCISGGHFCRRHVDSACCCVSCQHNHTRLHALSFGHAHALVMNLHALVMNFMAKACERPRHVMSTVCNSQKNASRRPVLSKFDTPFLGVGYRNDVGTHMRTVHSTGAVYPLLVGPRMGLLRGLPIYQC